MRYPVNHISISQGLHNGNGIDFGWWKNEYKGQDIMSCDNGTVLKIENQTTGGNTIFIKHDNGYVSCYGHLDKISVNIGQKVEIEQKIGTMGETGIVTGQHLHFAIYSKALADKGFNKKGLYGDSDINPFDVCYVYPDQEVRTTGTTKNYLTKFKYYEDTNVWEVGDYKLLYDKCLRKTHSLTANTYKVKDCSTLVKKYLTSKKPNDTAKLKNGTEFKVREIYKESNGRVWGKYAGMWLVLCNVTGEKQAKRI